MKLQKCRKPNQLAAPSNALNNYFPGLLMTALKKILSNDKTQRFFYFVGVILWTILWLQDDTSDYPNKSYDITWWIPVFLFILQIFFNHRVVWKLIFITLSIYSGFTLLLMISGLFTYHNIAIAIQCLSISFLWFTSCWVIYHLKPRYIKRRKR
jgi:hypothetical protein